MFLQPTIKQTTALYQQDQFTLYFNRPKASWDQGNFYHRNHLNSKKKIQADKLQRAINEPRQILQRYAVRLADVTIFWPDFFTCSHVENENDPNL